MIVNVDSMEEAYVAKPNPILGQTIRTNEKELGLNEFI